MATFGEGFDCQVLFDNGKFDLLLLHVLFFSVCDVNVLNLCSSYIENLGGARVAQW